MNIRICDGKGCSNAYVSAEHYSEPKNHIGWTTISRIDEVDPPARDRPRLKMKDPDLVHGEVTLDGKQLPFVIHKPNEIKQMEKEYDEFDSVPARHYTERRIELCPTCSPKLPEIKPEALT